MSILVAYFIHHYTGETLLLNGLILRDAYSTPDDDLINSVLRV